MILLVVTAAVTSVLWFLPGAPPLVQRAMVSTTMMSVHWPTTHNNSMNWSVNYTFDLPRHADAYTVYPSLYADYEACWYNATVLPRVQSQVWIDGNLFFHDSLAWGLGQDTCGSGTHGYHGGAPGEYNLHPGPLRAGSNDVRIQLNITMTVQHPGPGTWNMTFGPLHDLIIEKDSNHDGVGDGHALLPNTDMPLFAGGVAAIADAGAILMLRRLWRS